VQAVGPQRGLHAFTSPIVEKLGGDDADELRLDQP
jgi:hypothetical protein